MSCKLFPAAPAGVAVVKVPHGHGHHRAEVVSSVEQRVGRWIVAVAVLLTVLLLLVVIAALLVVALIVILLSVFIAAAFSAVIIATRGAFIILPQIHARTPLSPLGCAPVATLHGVRMLRMATLP